MTDDVDVVVTDGFTGNVALKTLEGGMQDPGQRRCSRRSAPPTWPTRRSTSLLPLYATLDPDNTGGAMLLGVDGVCIISHGSSSATAMVNAMRVAQEMVEADVVGHLRAAVAPPERPILHKRTKSSLATLPAVLAQAAPKAPRAGSNLVALSAAKPPRQTS